MAGNQRLRWWQEETSSKSEQSASERLASSPNPLLPETAVSATPASPISSAIDAEEADTWAELEAEAARRVAQVKVEASESVSFYTDKAAMLARYRRYQWTVLPFIIGQMLYNFYIAFKIPNPLFNLIIGVMPLLIFVFVKSRTDWVQKSEEPAVRLSPQGIYLCTLEHRNVMLAWGELVSTELKGSGKYRHLELCGGEKRRFAIYEYNLPFTVEVLAARIADYRAARETA